MGSKDDGNDNFDQVDLRQFSFFAAEVACLTGHRRIQIHFPSGIYLWLGGISPRSAHGALDIHRISTCRVVPWRYCKHQGI